MQLMEQKRNQDNLNRSLEMAGSQTSPGHIGDGYQQQLAHMQERDRAHSLQTQAYNSNMLGNSPARQQQLQAENRYAMTNQQLLNERAKQAQDYQARVRDEHKARLLGQMENDKRAKQEAERMEKQDDAQQAQRAGLFNSMFD